MLKHLFSCFFITTDLNKAQFGCEKVYSEWKRRVVL